MKFFANGQLRFEILPFGEGWSCLVSQESPGSIPTGEIMQGEPVPPEPEESEESAANSPLPPVATPFQEG